MSIIIRITVVAACAFAGSAVAGIQFSDLPDQHQVSTSDGLSNGNQITERPR
jgi:hypothetical protein